MSGLVLESMFLEELPVAQARVAQVAHRASQCPWPPVVVSGHLLSSLPLKFLPQPRPLLEALVSPRFHQHQAQWASHCRSRMKSLQGPCYPVVTEVKVGR